MQIVDFKPPILPQIKKAEVSLQETMVILLLMVNHYFNKILLPVTGKNHSP